MRLAVFTNQFPGRLNTFFARDMRALIEAGVELEIFAFYPLDETLWDHVPPILGPEVLPRDLVHHLAPFEVARASVRVGAQSARFLRDAAPLVAASGRYGPAATARAAYAAAFARGCVTRWGQQRFDHVLAYWGNYAASVAYLFHRHTQPSIPFSMFLHARMDLYRQPAFLRRKMLHADNILVVCEYNRRYLAKHYSDIYPRVESRIAVHHLGLPLEQIPVAPNSDGVGARLVAVGNLEPLKGFAGLLEAMAKLRDAGISVHLDLVGEGRGKGELQQLTQRLDLAERVTFHGYQPADRVLAIMGAATVMVHPSIRPDAMPTVIKEAMAVGVPVIASDLAGIPEILDRGRCGLLVPPGDVPALASALKSLLADPVRRHQFSMLGRQHMEQQFDLWKNGALLAERLRSTQRVGGH